MNIEALKRIFKYIFRGVPIEYVTVNVHVNNLPERLKGKWILITGGSKGIGYAIAEKCINEGAYVIICGRNESDLRVAKEKLGSNCFYVVFDVADVDSIALFIDKVFKLANGWIDCLVNNAGISYHEMDFRCVTEQGFKEQFNVNFVGAYFISKYFIQKIESIKDRKFANILFITSERGSFCTDIPYGLSKASINSLVGALSNKLYKKSHIRVNALAPGVTVSNMTGRSANENMAYDGSPTGRVFMPEEMAEVACFLLSDYSSCISGEIIHCDAGAHLKCI